MEMLFQMKFCVESISTKDVHINSILLWLFLPFPYYCSAGIGVLNAARKTMARLLGNNEVAFNSAKSQFWVVDAKVLYSL